MIEKANNAYLTGYLDGLIEAQMKVYGYNFLSECLTEPFVKAMYEVMPYHVSEGSFTSLDKVYADYSLCRRIAYLERTTILQMLAEQYKVRFYTKNPDAVVGKAINMGPVDYYNQMPVVFQQAKVNLNITLRSIKTGMSLRALDIMGAGGFLLSNYQDDFCKHFEPDKELVLYGSMDEMEEKTAYYLKHDTQRERIAKKVS